jgi:hypothetical protein
MPTKAQLNRRRQTAAARCAPKETTLKYLSNYAGLSDTIFTKGVESLHDESVGGFNAHYWIVNEKGKIVDPTPASPEYPPLQCKNGSLKPFYKEFSEDIQLICNGFREGHFNRLVCEGVYGNVDEIDEYMDDYYGNPRPMMCYQNCRAYIRKHPKCKMVCGAFGYIVDIYPNPCPPELKKLKKYVSLDFGY